MGEGAFEIPFKAASKSGWRCSKPNLASRYGAIQSNLYTKQSMFVTASDWEKSCCILRACFTESDCEYAPDATALNAFPAPRGTVSYVERKRGNLKRVKGKKERPRTDRSRCRHTHSSIGRQWLRIPNTWAVQGTLMLEESIGEWGQCEGLLGFGTYSHGTRNQYGCWGLDFRNSTCKRRYQFIISSLLLICWYTCVRLLGGRFLLR